MMSVTLIVNRGFFSVNLSKSEKCFNLVRFTLVFIRIMLFVFKYFSSHFFYSHFFSLFLPRQPFLSCLCCSFNEANYFSSTNMKGLSLGELYWLKQNIWCVCVCVCFLCACLSMRMVCIQHSWIISHTNIQNIKIFLARRKRNKRGNDDLCWSTHHRRGTMLRRRMRCLKAECKQLTFSFAQSKGNIIVVDLDVDLSLFLQETPISVRTKRIRNEILFNNKIRMLKCFKCFKIDRDMTIFNAMRKSLIHLHT